MELRDVFRITTVQFLLNAAFFHGFMEIQHFMTVRNRFHRS
jgi:hypothetical protein